MDNNINDYRWENSQKSSANPSQSTPNGHDAHGQAMHDFAEECKKVINNFIDEGCERLENAQEELKHYKTELDQKVNQHPLMSLLIAGAAGYIVSRLMSK